MDEASLYLQATTMAVWGPRGQPLTVRTDPGRAKTSFYGALNLKTGQVLAQQVEHMTAEAEDLDDACAVFAAMLDQEKKKAVTT